MDDSSSTQEALRPTTANGRLPRRACLLAAGSNSDGQLGIGHDDDAHRLHRCVRLPIGEESDSSFPPLGSRVVQLASGAGHTIAVVEQVDGQRQVWATGTGAEGQLGPAHVGARKTVAFQQLDCDTLLHAAKVIDVKAPHRWRPKLAACGWNWTLLSFACIDDRQDDVLLVLGSTNDFGQLGRGTDRHYSMPVARVQLPAADDGSHRVRIERIACGMRHSLVLCSDETRGGDSTSQPQRRRVLLGWGAARHGQIGDDAGLSAVGAAICRPSSKPTAVVWKPRRIQSWSKAANVDEAFHAFLVSTGKEHSAVWVPPGWRAEEATSRLVDGGSEHCRLLVFGSNRLGQTDLQRAATCANTHTRMLSVECTWSGTLALSSDVGNGQRRFTVQRSGSNTKGQMGVGPSDEPRRPLAWTADADSTDEIHAHLACGSEHAVVLLPASATQSTGPARVLGWGWNEHGNLAQDDEIDRFEPVQLWPPADGQESIPHKASPTHVWAGCATTYVQVMC